MTLKYIIDNRIHTKYKHNFFFKARRIHKINVRKCVIIFDEAHNIEQQCEDACSIMISSLDLAACIDDITKVMEWMVESKSSTPSLAISTDDNEDNNIDKDGRFFVIKIICF